MQIGFTERGDAGRDLTWMTRLNSVDGIILITKSVDRPDFQTALFQAHARKPVILHATITGWGGTLMEPGVADCNTTLQALRNIIDKGFPAERIVLRVDPIIPTDEGITRACNVLALAYKQLPEVKRIRISIYDDYPKARAEMMRRGYPPLDNIPYKNEQGRRPRQNQVQVIGTNLPNIHPGTVFECCAEPELVSQFPEHFQAIGCCSFRDLDILGLQAPDNLRTNMQNRYGCLCISVKTELLTRRARCTNNCAYCYWGA